MRISVNISAIDFRQRNFVANLTAILEHTGLAPGLLELEITESMLMQNVEDTFVTLRGIKAWACGCPSTISAPVIPASVTCEGFPSMC
jgi:EAL domain-containing protein (putative c-di-GMP-specific phosphodiesterase class I)